MKIMEMKLTKKAMEFKVVLVDGESGLFDVSYCVFEDDGIVYFGIRDSKGVVNMESKLLISENTIEIVNFLNEVIENSEFKLIFDYVIQPNGTDDGFEKTVKAELIQRFPDVIIDQFRLMKEYIEKNF